jgi:uncharacterized protein (TIGR03435 family)
MLKFPTLRLTLRGALVSSFAGLMLLVPPTVPAQTTVDETYVPTLTFDVASIRESPPMDGSLRVNVNNPPHASRFEVTNFTAKSLLQMAYGFGVPISGGPDWLTQTYFTVQAKSDHSVDEQLAKLTDDQAKLEKQHMLQVLLADRLHLKVHFETKESSVYALVIAKGGSKLHETKVEPTDPDQPKLPVGAQGPDVKANGGRLGLEFNAQRFSTKALAALLSSQIQSPVVDQTGLTGSYDFVLQMGREWSAGNPDSWPSVFTAVQEQLGLKLESTKAAVPNLIIDHIETPSAN